jgi:hypothetical protein
MGGANRWVDRSSDPVQLYATVCKHITISSVDPTSLNIVLGKDFAEENLEAYAFAFYERDAAESFLALLARRVEEKWPMNKGN